MPIAPINVVGPSATGRSVAFNPGRTVNLFPEGAVSADADTPVALLGTAGLSGLVTLPNGPVRGMHTMGTRLFAVAQDGLYEVLSGGTYTRLASLRTFRGPVGLSDNNGYLVVGDGTGFFTYSFTTGLLTLILDSPRGTWCAYIDGYTLFLERETGFVYPSLVDDPTEIDFLARFNAESDPDSVLQIVTNGPEVWLMGEVSAEVFYNSGDADNIFQRISSGRIEQGCLAARSARYFDNSIVWVGADEFGAGIVWRAQGFTPVRISTHAVEYAISRETTPANITAIVWQEGGHSFYQINLPGAGTSWVYDAATSEWHERAWWNTETGAFERHRADHHAYAFGMHLVGDYESGKIYRQSLDIYSDDGNPLRAYRRIGVANSGGTRISVAMLEVFMETGLAGAVEPTMTLRVSYDGGRNWGNERSIAIGAIGETGTRAIWRRLGQGRDWALELVITDPVPRRLFGGRALVSVGAN
jgi:hypothetical protein